MAQNQTGPGRGKAPNVVSSTKTSKRGFYVLIGVVALIGIATLSYLSTRKGASSVVTLDPKLPPVASAGYVIGSPTAPLEVTEFGDFECPYCSMFATLTEPDVRENYIKTGKIRFRFIDFPLSMHKNTVTASVSAACADEQGAFWPMHDLLYSKQDQWNGEATDNPIALMKQYARTLPGVDGAKFDDCLDNRRTLAKVQAHLALAEQRQVGSTPTFVIGNQQVTIDRGGSDEFRRYLDAALARIDSAKSTTKKP